MQLDSSFFDHVDLLSVLFLVIQHVSLEELQWLELRHYFKEELVVLIFEEVDLLNDLAVGALYDLILQLMW